MMWCIIMMKTCSVGRQSDGHANPGFVVEMIGRRGSSISRRSTSASRWAAGSALRSISLNGTGQSSWTTANGRRQSCCIGRAQDVVPRDNRVERLLQHVDVQLAP